MAITRETLLPFLRQERYAVHAAVSDDGAPHAAVVRVVISPDWEIFFDTVAGSDRVSRPQNNPVATLVFGPVAAGAGRTAQVQGDADEPLGQDLERLLDLFYTTFPDGREHHQRRGVMYWRVRPTWIRFSDYSTDPPTILELTASDLR